MAEVNVGTALGTGWARLTESAVTLLSIGLLAVASRRLLDLVVTAMMTGFAPLRPLPPAFFIVLGAAAFLLMVLVVAPLAAGLSYAALVAARRAAPQWSHVGIGWRRLFAVVALAFVQSMLVVGAIVAPLGALEVLGSGAAPLWLALLVAWILLGIPVAVFLAVRWSFGILHLLDEHCGPVAALRRSWHVSGNRPGTVFGVVLVGMAGAVVAQVLDSAGGGLIAAGFAVEVLVTVWMGVTLAVLYTWLGGGRPSQPRPGLPTEWEPILAEGVVYARPAGSG